MQMMGYWGHRPPPVPRDGPESTKKKRTEAAQKSVGVGKEGRKKEAEKPKSDAPAEKKPPKSKKRDNSADESLRQQRPRLPAKKVGDSEESDSCGSHSKMPKSDAPGEKKPSKRKKRDNSADESLRQQRPRSPAKEIGDSEESDSSGSHCSGRKARCEDEKKKSDRGAGTIKPIRQGGGRGTKEKSPPQFLLDGRYLSVPISVDGELERPYLGQIVGESVEQFLIYFKEDGDKMWYDKEEVKETDGLFHIRCGVIFF